MTLARQTTWLDADVRSAAVEAYLATQDQGVYLMGLELAEQAYRAETDFIQRTLRAKQEQRKKYENNQRFFQELFILEQEIGFLNYVLMIQQERASVDQQAVEDRWLEKRQRDKRAHEGRHAQTALEGREVVAGKAGALASREKAKASLSQLDATIEALNSRHQAFMEDLGKTLQDWRERNQQALEKEAAATAQAFRSVMSHELSTAPLAQEDPTAVAAIAANCEKELKETLVRRETNAGLVRLGIGGEAYKAAIMAEARPQQAAEEINQIMDLKNSLFMQLMMVAIARNANRRAGFNDKAALKNALVSVNGDSLQALIQQHQDRVAMETEPMQLLMAHCLEVRYQYEETLGRLNQQKDQLFAFNPELSLFKVGTSPSLGAGKRKREEEQPLSKWALPSLTPKVGRF